MAINEPVDFLDFLKSQGLFYPTDVIENFLLSLKVKPFVILSGGSGTGKTKLAQMYGKYLSDHKSDETVVETSVTLGKADKNGAWTLKSEEFFSSFPLEDRKHEGKCKFIMDGKEYQGNLKYTVRMFFDKKSDIPEHILRLKENGKSEKLKVIVPNHVND